jgi:predicted DNA-binding transcriptional regulator AlpA
MTDTKNADRRFMRMRQLTDYTSFSRTYLYNLIRDGKFPAGKSIADRLVVWERTDVDAAMDSLIGGAA